VPSPAAQPRERYESVAAAFVKENRIPGAAVGVVHDGELVWSKGIGYADLEKKRRSSPKGLYRIASITKTFTAAAIMQLRDAGKLSLDDPAVTYLPELEQAANAFGPVESLTIRRMLSHESGLQSEPPGTDWSLVRYESDPVATLARVEEIATTVPPNLQWKYSNLAYQLLGEIVERVSETPYRAYVGRKLLTPLGMSATTFDPVPARLRARQATGYEPRFLSDELEPAPHEHDIFGAEGGLWSCVEDLARWLSCQFTGKTASGKVLLGAETLREMHKPRYLVDDAWTRAWAIGWYAVRKNDVVWRMHSGGHYGFITDACFDPEEKVGAIALLNGFASAPELAMELGGIAREAVTSAAPAIELPKRLPAKWRPLVGLYLTPHWGSVIRIEWRDGKLTILDPDDPTWTPTLVATDEPDVFCIEPGYRESGELVRFQRNKKGRVVSVVVAVATMERLEPADDDRD
jgi:CubicO group peptidase (beta-lactamase class C family)